MPPKKKLSKKEKARLEAEQAELLRIEMEKERLKKLEEERQRKKIEREQAKRRQQEEIQENKTRRTQLKHSMTFFGSVQKTIEGIKTLEQEERDWEKFMRCNGLPNANSPSDLRKYLHQWRSYIATRNKESRNWLLRTNERTLLTQDANVPDLSRATLRRQQGNLGDVYAKRIDEVLGILVELDEAIAHKMKPAHTIADLQSLKTEIRVFLSEYLDEFTYKTLSHIERDMEIDRPGVSKHLYRSDVFKSQFWTFSKDAQISLNPKMRIGDQNTHNEIEFADMDMQISLPPSVQLQTSALRGLWLNYDHFSDNCATFNLKKPRSDSITILMQTKREWRKRKEILQSMIDECDKEIPISANLAPSEQESPVATQQAKERSFDVDKLYGEYEDELIKSRKRAIGPEAYGLFETDVNLRKYRIIGGVYCINYLDTPQQDKQINSRSFIRTIVSPDKLARKSFFQTYKPPPAPQPGVRRLPEEIEAEMRMIEAALDKLALVTVQLPDSVIWFEPPIPCRWESKLETLESDLTDGAKPATTATPTEMTPLSTTTNPSPLKSSPRFPAKLRKRSSQKSTAGELPVREVNDFNMFNIPSGIDIYGLLKDFVVPRLPQGFCVRFHKTATVCADVPNKQEKVLFLARHKSVNPSRPIELKIDVDNKPSNIRAECINENFLDLDEPREFFASAQFEKVLKFKEPEGGIKVSDDGLNNFRSSKKLCNTTKELVECNGKISINANSIAEHQQPNGSNGNGTTYANDQRNEDDNSSGISSRRTSNASVASNAHKAYMFSQLLKDLDRLCELQMPLQEEALKRLSTNLTNSTAASVAASQDEQDEEDQQEQQQQQATDLMQPTFGYFPGISFVRDLQAQNGKNSKENKLQLNEEEDLSSEYDDEYDIEAEEAYYYNTAENGEDDALNSLGGATTAATATSSLVEFLSKHNQSDSDSGSSGGIAQVNALTQGKWSTRDVHDTKFNEDKLSIQFRTGRLGFFGFALNRYSNMPYQTWEIKPDMKSPGSILFSFTASIVSLDMTITVDGYCLNNFQGGSTKAINDIIGKTLTLAQLKHVLVTSAVDIFPEEDAFCYTEGSCEKNYVMEIHLYACISTLAQSHNFSWSRWNLLAGSRMAVLLIREFIEGKKIPNHSTLLVTPLKTSIIECTEVSASFNATGIAGMEYYADLYQLSQVHAQACSLEKQRTMDPVLRDNVARILIAIRPLSFC